MVLKLVGNPLSTCTLRVVVVLKEKKVPYELIEIDYRKGDHKSPSFLEKQPFGQAPYLDDDGFIVYESRAICRYIASKYKDKGTKLIPGAEDVQATARFEQAVSIEMTNFDVFAVGLYIEKIVRPMIGLLTEENVVERNATTLNTKLDGYEVILSKQKYLAGDEITLADLFHLPFGARLATIGYNWLEDDTRRPNLARWWKDITSRPSWQAVKDGA